MSFVRANFTVPSDEGVAGCLVIACETRPQSLKSGCVKDDEN